LPTLRANAIASNAPTEGDIVQGSPANGIEQRVDEPERGFTGAEARVVEKTDNRGDDGGCGRSSSRWRELTTVYYLVAGVGQYIDAWKYFVGYLLGGHAVSADIRESSATKVRERLIVFLHSGADVEVQIRLNGKLLVRRAREVVAEAPSATHPSLFGADSHSSSDCGDIWAGSWELWGKLWGLLAIVALARSADSIVARRFENGDSAESHQSDEIANFNSIFLRDGLLVISIGV
jgi:hypothetical protein